MDIGTNQVINHFVNESGQRSLILQKRTKGYIRCGLDELKENHKCVLLDTRFEDISCGICNQYQYMNLFEITLSVNIPDSKVHGANMGPTWVRSAPDGPHVGPMNLAIGDMLQSFSWFRSFLEYKLEHQIYWPQVISLHDVHLENKSLHWSAVYRNRSGLDHIQPCFQSNNTVRCRHNAVNFLQNRHKRHPIVHPLGLDMGWGVYCEFRLAFTFWLSPVIDVCNIMLYWIAL